MAALGEAAPVQRALRAVDPPLPGSLPAAALLPPQQLRLILLHYKGHAVAFDAAWLLSLDLITWPASRREASDWRAAVECSREGWRACYEGWPPEAHEIAVGELARILSDELRRDAA